MNLIDHFFNSLFPDICPCCLNALTGLFQCICPKCRKKFQERLAINCVNREKISAAGIAEDRHFFFNNLNYLSTYQTFEKSLFSLAKFSGNKAAKEFIFRILLEKIYQSDDLSVEKYDFIIPAPSSRKLTDYFADLLSRQFNIPVLNIFKKNQKAESKKLSRFDRFFQIQNIIDLDKSVLPFNKNSRILVFDDLWTTGATLNNMCRILSAHGISSSHIDCLVLFLRMKYQISENHNAYAQR